MKAVVVLIAVLGLMACAKKKDSSSSPSSESIGICYFPFGSDKACIQLDANVSQADRASACSGGTTSAETTCPTSYSGVSSHGKCSLVYMGLTNIYRFYVNNLSAETTACSATDDNGGTATWIAD